jgi:hypothetical protein
MTKAATEIVSGTKFKPNGGAGTFSKMEVVLQ